MSTNENAVDDVDLLIIGAGPAGMAAAIEAGDLGIDTLVVDEKLHPGGQIYSGLAGGAAFDRSVLGRDYLIGKNLIDRFQACGARARYGAFVWDMTPDNIAYISTDGTSRMIRARHAIVATGALERPFAFEGWTLPGVITAGGAQLLLKTSAVVPQEPVVLAGSGPLLLLLATQYIACGVSVAAILDITPAGNRLGALRHFARFIPTALAAKGLAMLWKLRAGGVPILSGVEDIAALGSARVEAVRYRRGGEEYRLPASCLIVHQGIESETRLLRAVNVEHRWDNVSRSWLPVCDDFGRTAIPGVSVAGDGRAVLGAQAAPLSGRLAAIDAARALGRIDVETRDRLTRPVRAQLGKASRGRGFVDTLFAPSPTSCDRLPGEALACRCEEVTAKRVREEATRSAANINSVKSRLRCGMGPCQGRYCETTVRELLLRHSGSTAAEIGLLRIRPPIKPVGVEEIIALGVTELPPEARIPGVLPR